MASGGLTQNDAAGAMLNSKDVPALLKSDDDAMNAGLDAKPIASFIHRRTARCRRVPLM